MSVHPSYLTQPWMTKTFHTFCMTFLAHLSCKMYHCATGKEQRAARKSKRTRCRIPDSFWRLSFSAFKRRLSPCSWGQQNSYLLLKQLLGILLKTIHLVNSYAGNQVYLQLSHFLTRSLLPCYFKKQTKSAFAERRLHLAYLTKNSWLGAVQRRRWKIQVSGH